MRSAGYEIAVFPGDGTGPEVIREGERVLAALAEGGPSPWTSTRYAGGGQYFLQTGREWDADGEAAARRADAILLGAVGWPGATLPNGDIAGRALVLGLREGLDLYANVRPCKLYDGVTHRISGEYRQVWTPKNVDLVIVRENTEDLYTPARGRLTRGGETEVAVDTRLITRKGAERVIRRAFEIARARPRGAPGDGVKRVTCVDKSNVMEGCRFFRETFDRIGPEYPEIARDYAYVDAFCQWLIRNPERYDVVVATNMMGDIVTDLAAVLQGGMGFASGANLGDGHGMFEPVHGSAPKYAGKNQVNPYATFFAIGQMLRWLGEGHSDRGLVGQADRLERVLARTLADGGARTYDQGGTASTSDAGDRVVAAIRGEAR